MIVVRGSCSSERLVEELLLHVLSDEGDSSDAEFFGEENARDENGTAVCLMLMSEIIGVDDERGVLGAGPLERFSVHEGGILSDLLEFQLGAGIFAEVAVVSSMIVLTVDRNAELFLGAVAVVDSVRLGKGGFAAEDDRAGVGGEDGRLADGLRGLERGENGGGICFVRSEEAENDGHSLNKKNKKKLLF